MKGLFSSQFVTVSVHSAGSKAGDMVEENQLMVGRRQKAASYKRRQQLLSVIFMFYVVYFP